MNFFALSLVYPGVDRILSGRKTLEIRQWAPDALSLRDLLLVQNHNRLGSNGMQEDLDGRAMALVDVVAVRPWMPEDCPASCSRPEAWEPGWLAWELTRVRSVSYARSVPARLRIYSINVEDDEFSWRNALD